MARKRTVSLFVGRVESVGMAATAVLRSWRLTCLNGPWPKPPKSHSMVTSPVVTGYVRMTLMFHVNCPDAKGRSPAFTQKEQCCIITPCREFGKSRGSHAIPLSLSPTRPGTRICIDLPADSSGAGTDLR